MQNTNETKNSKEKFATQVDPALLSGLRHLSEEEGKKIQFLVEEALKLLFEKRKQQEKHQKALSAYQKSHLKYADLYAKLAK